MDETAKDVTFLDLAWDDVLFQNVLPHLSIKDCFNLRAASKSHRNLVDSYFTKIKKIDLSTYRTFSSREFEILTSGSGNIRQLNLSKSKWLTDDQIGRVFRNNPLITQVILNECLGLTSGCLHPLVMHCRSLKCLKLQNCHWVTGPCLEALALHQRLLEDADFTSCWDLNDAVMTVFLKSFINLKRLSLSNIYSITDNTLFMIALNCRSLRHLSLKGCWRITDYGVRMVGEYCRQLESLHITDCQKVTEYSLAPLRGRLVIDKTRIGNNMYTTACMDALRLSLQV